MRRSALLAFAALAPAAARAQATAYVPLDYWGMPYVEYLVARGVLADPSPLTRPLRRAELRRALEAADTAALGAGLRRIVRALVADLETGETGPWGRVTGHFGTAAATHARRDPLRDAGPGHVTFSGGLDVQARFGPLVAVTHPSFDTRLKWDPDYAGKQDRALAGRNAEAYLAARWTYVELAYGTLARNWGWPAVEGLLVSPAPYSYDHLGLAVGTDAVRLEGIVTQLDDLPDTAGAANRRYWVAHRLLLRPWRATTLTLWEGTIVAGRDRALEPWFANIINLGLLAQYDQGAAANHLLGLDVATRAGGVSVYGSVLLDDVQIDDATPGDREPASYGVTLGAQGALGAAVWTAFYTRVSNLAYRTPDPVETVMRRGVGLARNFADYDQLTVRATGVIGPGVLFTPEVTLLRQGEGDFRRPYPTVAEFATTPVFLAGVVEQTVRLAAELRVEGRRFSLTANGGLHLVDDARHVPGAEESRFAGGVAVSYRFSVAGELP